MTTLLGPQGARVNGVADVGCADAAMVDAIVYSAAAGMARCGLTDVGRSMGCVQTWGSLAVFLQAGDTPTVGFQLKLGSLPCALYSRGVGKDARIGLGCRRVLEAGCICVCWGGGGRGAHTMYKGLMVGCGSIIVRDAQLHCMMQCCMQP
jgi:hypothetical protein